VPFGNHDELLKILQTPIIRWFRPLIGHIRVVGDRVRLLPRKNGRPHGKTKIKEQKSKWQNPGAPG
jgi:hypothetical protein